MTSTQGSIFDVIAGREAKPHFDGKTYEPDKDHARLSSQLAEIRDFMLEVRKRRAEYDQWWTLTELAIKFQYPESSISARLRDLRKTKFGGYTVERRRRTEGTFEYRVTK